MKKLTSLLVLFITIYSQTFVWAQTGPGGIGNATGTNGQPNNIIWLRADDLGLSNGAAVSAWADASGNGNDLGESAVAVNPEFVTGQINSLPIVRFSVPATTTGTRLVRNPFSNFASSAVTAITVYQTTDTDYGLISYDIASRSNEYLLMNHNDANRLSTYINSSRNPSLQALSTASFQIITHKWRNSNGELHLIQNGTDLHNVTGFRTGSSIVDGGSLAIGNEQDVIDGGYNSTQAFVGDIAEIIMFSSYLNDAQRTIIENYLNIKYGITISNDVFTLENASYDYGITGIGQEADGNHTSTVSSGTYLVNNGALDDGDYIMMSHNNSVNAVSTSDLPGTVEERWGKDWYVEQTGSQNLQLVFDLPEGIAGGQFPQNISNYVLLYRNTTSGNYSIATVSSVGYGDSDQVAFDILGADLTNGYYTLGTTDQTNSPVLGAAGTTWYTLVSGDWNDQNIWTLDPSGALPNNPSGLYPQNVTDKVVIKSGKNINMNLNDIHCTSLTVDGRLDLNTSTGHTFDVIKGNGRFLMAADNFPSFTDMSHFNSAGQGEGTVVYYGATSYSLNTSYTFFNMEVNMDIGQTVTLLSDYTVNGYFRIDQGTFRINDNSASTNLNFAIYGNVIVQSAGLISTGTANARHQFNFYGDFTNSGDVRFTNRVAADYTNEATNGIVDANFLNTSKNQSILCNGTTNFYRIEIDKGTDATYILDIQASATANFNLFGYAAQTHGGYAQLDDGAASANQRNPNALGLYRGTVKIGANINIPVLNNTNNYNISEAAQLWVAGGTVQKNSGEAIVSYGVARISSGTFESLVRSGFTTRDNGLIKVEGGTLNTNQIRTSVLGVGNVGGYVQSGGTVNIINPGSTNNTYYHFSMTYPGNTFNMSGGTLHVYDANGTATNQGGIFIASDPENVNVTGGTVIADIASTTNSFKITSTAPFYNLILRNSAANTSDHILDGGSNINGTADADLAAQPLVVLNDLTIEGTNSSTLVTNNLNVSIGHNLRIEEGATYDYGTNTTIFNGTEDGELYIGHSTGNGYEQLFYDFTVNKPVGKTLLLTGDSQKEAANVSPLWNSRLVQITNDFILESGTFNQGEHSIRLFGTAEVKKDGICGVYNNLITETNASIVLRGDGLIIQTENGAQFGNVKIDVGSPGSDEIAFTSDVYIKRIGYTDGRVNMGIYNIKVDYLHDGYTTDRHADGGANEMFYGAGNASDGGLSLLTIENGTYIFPIGVSGKYTPAEVIVTDFDDDGYIQIRPVDGELKTTDLAAGDLLDYYWRVGHEDFTTNPTVQYQFVYDNGDIVGAENGYYPGKVLDENPYTRSYEAQSNLTANNNTITFNDTGGTSGNTGNGFILENANYTAGVAARFTGAPNIYYTDEIYQNWSNGAIWHLGSKVGATGTVPEEGSIAIIYNDAANRGRVWGNGLVDEPAEIKFEHNYVVNPTPNSENVPRLQFNNPGTYPLGRITGTGMVSFDAPDAITLTGDFGEFGNNEDSYYLYFGGAATINNVPTPIPSIMFEGSAKSVDQSLNVGADYIVQGNTTITQLQDVVIERDLILGFWSGGTFQFPGSGTPIAVTVNRNIDFTRQNDNQNRRIWVQDNTANIENRLILKGDIIHGDNNGASRDFIFWRASNRSKTILELQGTGDNNYSRGTAPIPVLYRLIQNKGTDQTSTFTFSDDVTLNGPTSGVGIDKALEFQNGTLILDDVDINFDLTTGDDNFSIPSTSALEVLQGQVNANGNSGILLDGKLLVSGGTVDMTGGDNYIQYSATGNAEIEVTSGTLQVGSQIRRSTGSTEGILIYTQSGGTVVIGTDAAGAASRGIFEILNTGSSYTHSAGSFTLVNDYRSNPSTQSFYFNPETVNLSTGTEITFGDANTIAAESDFTMYAGKDLMNLVIDNTSSNNPKLTMEVLPLTLTENLTIGSGTELDANGWDINMHGNFINNGTFTANQNKVYFIGADDQEIEGTTTFYELYKNTETNTLSLATGSEITIDNYLSLETGGFDDNNNNVNVKGNLFSSITTLSSGTSDGIVLNGTDEQTITGSGTYARLTTDNATGMIVPTGYTITITDSLQMRSGVFSIGQNLIVLTVDADIIEASPFSESNMIQTNISFTDAGVEKYFPVIAAPTTFIYPMGSAGKYTPVKFDITSNGNATGSIRIRAADEFHPSVIEDSETPELVDAENVLQYYWTLDADGITGFSATATMDCYAEDVLVNSPDYTEADYITARLLNAALGTWDKFSNVDFNESTYELYFYFTGTNDQGVDGDYTAGIDDAIPDQVPGYISFQDGDWSDLNTWQTYPALEGQGVNVPAGGPRGSIVYIEHEVTTPANFVSAYITRILAGGTVNVGTTFGHRLGFVSGTGTLYLERGDMPAGVYDDFFAPDSGTIEFSGIDDIDILSEVLSVNNLTLTGTGDRVFPNLDLIIHGNLIINGPDVLNTHNESVEVRKDITFTSGTFDAGTDNGGDVNDGMFIIGGSTTQNLNGPATFTGTYAFNNFKMNNPIGLVLSQPIDIDDELVFANGPITTTSTNILTLHSFDENAVTGAGPGNYVDGPMLKNVNTGGTFDFPLGNGNRYGNVVVSATTTTGNQYWEAQYYNNTPLSGTPPMNPATYNSPLQSVSDNEYWRIESPVTTTAKVTIRWDNNSGMPTDDVNRSKIRMAEWRDINNDSPGTTTDDIWEEAGINNLVSGTQSSGTIVQNDTTTTFNEFGNGNYFTLATTYLPQIFTWTGGSTTQWNNSANWNVALIPTNSDEVIIPDVSGASGRDPIIGIDARCGTMDLQSGAILTINSNGSLALSGALTMDGDITLKSDATGTGALLDNGTIGGAGIATIERYLSGNNYHYISSSVSAAAHTIFSVAPWGDDNPNFYVYDETNNDANWLFGWDHATAVAGNMTVARGYASWLDRDYTYSVTGGGFNTGNLNYNISHSNYGIQSDGWNLIGNPYPSAINADEFIDANSSVINGTLYFWDDDGSDGSDYDTDDYATWNLAGAVGTGNGSSSSNGTKVPDGFIGAGQGFFVRKTNAGTDPINFTNSMRRIGNGQFFKKQKSDDIWRLKLSVSNTTNKLYNETLIAFVDGAHDEFDNLYDGVKLKGSSEIAFYSKLGDEDLAIQSFGLLYSYDEKTVPLGMMINQAGDYTLTVQQFENFEQYVNVYLKDNLLDSVVDLKAVNMYTFTTNSGTYENRFAVYFNNIPPNEGVVNHRPVVANSMADVQATEDVGFELVISESTFNDVDLDDKLIYDAKLAGGSDLPTWLSFNADNRTFSGTPENADVATLDIQVTVTDQSDESVYDVFVLSVINVNDTPELVNEIPDQEIDEGFNYSYTIPANTFNDIDLGDTLQLSVKQADGSGLPSWMIFDLENGRLYGTADNPGDINIVVTATDQSGETVFDEYTLTVKSTTGINSLLSSEVTIYPNPTQGAFFVKTDYYSDDLMIIVRDFGGRVIKQVKPEGKETEINISEFSSGMYFIELNNRKESIVYKIDLNK